MKNITKIIATAKALPAYSRPTAEILPLVEQWLEGQPERLKEKVLRIFKYAQVDRRYSIMSPEEVFTQTSFEDKNNLYAERMTDLAEKALSRALEKANLQPDQLDYIITTSCTGIMIPSVDAYLINRLHLRQDIVRLPVTEMGCAGGTSALIYASELLKANEGKRAAVIAMESPTSTFQLDDYSMTNMVSAAIFGDGAACTILGPDPQHVKPVIQRSGMYHFYNEPHMMGFNLRNSGLQMILDPSVPEKIERELDAILNPFLAQSGLNLEDIAHFIFHPGGKKIVQLVEDRLRPVGGNIDETKAVLREYGNMSSATVLYVLEEFLEKVATAKSEYGLMLSFGPGFSAQRLLLQWQ